MSNRKIVRAAEYQILGSLINNLLDEGYQVKIALEGAVIFVSASEPDEKDKEIGWVKCVPGNGASYISDYSLALEPTISETILLAKSFED